MPLSIRSRGSSDDRIAAYDRGRDVVSHRWACNAPVTNIYFQATGRAAPCWRDLGASPEGWSSSRSIMDIWTSPFFVSYREALARQRFLGPCTACGDDIRLGIAPLAAVYDRSEPTPDRPTSFELELSNQCNFACEMCDGNLSSRIRRDREHLPPLVSPYDDAFVEQFADLLPTARDVRFSGGEPTMHPIVHKILEHVAAIRPDLPINISTNGSVLNTRVRTLMEGTDLRLFLSFDSLQAERYEAIRVGSDFEVLMRNIESFREHFTNHRGSLTINTNPMQPNWDEMATFVHWCSERNLALAFNTVVHPEHMALRSLGSGELHRIHAQMDAEELACPPDADPDLHRRNVDAYRNVVHQVAAWRDEARAREADPLRIR